MSALPETWRWWLRQRTFSGRRSSSLSTTSLPHSNAALAAQDLTTIVAKVEGVGPTAFVSDLGLLEIALRSRVTCDSVINSYSLLARESQRPTQITQKDPDWHRFCDAAFIRSRLAGVEDRKLRPTGCGRRPLMNGPDLRGSAKSAKSAILDGAARRLPVERN
jgi:hypothetical protein